MNRFLLIIMLLVEIIAPVKVGGGGLPYTYIEDRLNAYNDAVDARNQMIENELLEKAILAKKEDQFKKDRYRISRYIRRIDNKLRWNNYTRVISGLESSHRYYVKNKYGYLGKYQISGKYLTQLGYEGSEEDFLKDKVGQETTMVNYTFNNVKLIKKYQLTEYIGKEINGIQITLFGMMASAHLVGIKSLNEYLDSNGSTIHKDGNDTSIEKYMKAFS